MLCIVDCVLYHRAIDMCMCVYKYKQCQITHHIVQVIQILNHICTVVDWLHKTMNSTCIQHMYSLVAIQYTAHVLFCCFSTELLVLKMNALKCRILAAKMLL